VRAVAKADCQGLSDATREESRTVTASGDHVTVLSTSDVSKNFWLNAFP